MGVAKMGVKWDNFSPILLQVFNQSWNMVQNDCNTSSMHDDVTLGST